MKVLKDEEDNYIVYLLATVPSYDSDHKEEFVEMIKNMVLKINRIYHLHLNGFYKVRVYLHKKIGFVLEIIKLDDIEINHSIDLRVLVYFEQNFYLEVEDFDFLPEHKEVILFNNKYYVDVDCLEKKEIFSLLELGTLVYQPEFIGEISFGKKIGN